MMKKTIKMILLLIVMMMLLTGCVSINYDVTINENGSGKVAYTYAYKKEYLESMQTTIEKVLEPDIEKAQEKGYNVEQYSDDVYEGFKASKDITDITTELSLAELFGEDYVKDGENNNIKKSGKKFSQNATIDLTQMENMANFGIVTKYTVNLPTKVKTSNATTISEDGKTLTWELKLGEVNNIQFETQPCLPTNAILAILIIGIVLVVAVVVIVVIIVKKKKTKEKVNS